MHAFRTYIFAKAYTTPQRGLSAIADLLVIFHCTVGLSDVSCARSLSQRQAELLVDSP